MITPAERTGIVDGLRNLATAIENPAVDVEAEQIDEYRRATLYWKERGGVYVHASVLLPGVQVAP